MQAQIAQLNSLQTALKTARDAQVKAGINTPHFDVALGGLYTAVNSLNEHAADLQRQADAAAKQLENAGIAAKSMVDRVETLQAAAKAAKEPATPTQSA